MTPCINTDWVLDAQFYLMFHGVDFPVQALLEKLLSSFEGFCCQVFVFVFVGIASFHP